jgi:hypothetical protein
MAASSSFWSAMSRNIAFAAESDKGCNGAKNGLDHLTFWGRSAPRIVI